MTNRTLYLCMLLVSAAAAAVIYADRAGAAAYEIPAVLEIEVVGSEYQWEVHYPGPDGKLGTDDDEIGRRDVHVPSGTRARIHLRSRDYVYGFALPELGLKEVAIPELEFSLDVPPTQAQVTELRGNQMCGYTHPDLIGRLIVEPRDQYIASLKRLAH